MMPLWQLSLLLVGATGCDVVWGLSGQPSPCELGSFEESVPIPVLADGEHHSVTGDGTLAVLELQGKQFERELAAEQQVEITFYASTVVAFSLAPEGDLLFHTPAQEFARIQQEQRVDFGVWAAADRTPPRGTYAGVPSALEFGPRRVLVRLRASEELVQEYVDDGTAWVAVGEPQSMPGDRAPNLTANGLTVVFAAAGQVLAANREATDEAFGEPVLLRTADASSAQLLGNTTCDVLVVSESGLNRYER